MAGGANGDDFYLNWWPLFLRLMRHCRLRASAAYPWGEHELGAVKSQHSSKYCQRRTVGFLYKEAAITVSKEDFWKSPSEQVTVCVCVCVGKVSSTIPTWMDCTFSETSWEYQEQSLYPLTIKIQVWSIFWSKKVALLGYQGLRIYTYVGMALFSHDQVQKLE